MSAVYPSFEEFLPHGKEMILLEQIVSASEEDVLCHARVGSPLLAGFDRDPVSPLLGLEYIAQALAAFAACSPERPDKKNKDGIGLIANVKHLELHEPHFYLGQELEVRAHRDLLSDTTAVFTGLISDAKQEKKLLSATITLVVTDRSRLEKSTNYA